MTEGGRAATGGVCTLAATSQTGSVRLVVWRVVMAGSFGLPLLPVPKSTLRKQSQPWLAVYGGSHLLLFPIQQVVRPRTDAPQILCGAAPLGAVIVITPSARYLTARHMMAAKQRM